MATHETLSTFLKELDNALTKDAAATSGEGGHGYITSYKDGVIHIVGLADLKMNEVVSVEGLDVQALVLNLEQDGAYAVVLNHDSNLKEGMFVKSSGELLSFPVSDAFLGRVVDALGKPLDGQAPVKAERMNPIEKIAPGVITRQSVDQPVQTGILPIDAMIPVGRGQRELIIGDRQTGKTTIAIDTILNQKGQNMKCIYVAIGQREARIANVIATLKEHGAMEYTTVVSAGASSSAVSQYLAPMSGAALAEYFMSKGEDVLIIYDDLSKHAVAYREMSLLLRRPPGREAYPGDVFYLHSRLLERSARLNKENGGGSITALPIIETQAGDISAYIPTNVISITDGQIFLESSLFNKGIRPAINVGISVSRVGGSAQTKIMKKVSGNAKLNLTQYYELESFSQFASELDATTLGQLTRGRRVVEAMKQKQNVPYALWQEVAVLLISTEGYLDEVAPEACGQKTHEFLVFMEHKHSDLIQKIETEKALSDEIKLGLEAAMKEFFSA